MGVMDRAALYSFLAGQRYGVVSSISAEGSPQSALVGIAATQGLEIVFDTIKSSRKYANLTARPGCSFVVGWAGEQTVQMDGVAEELQDAEREAYLAVYFSVWPDGPARLNWPGITHFVVRPRWIRYSDFDQAPPLIQEFRFTAV